MTLQNWTLAHGDDLQVALFFLALGALIALERLRPRRTGPMNRRSRWTANFGLTAANLAVFGVLPVTLVGAAAWAADRNLGLLNAVALPLPALVVANLALRGFISFATHYLMHKVPLFWRVHRVHHLDTELDASTTVRVHPLEFAIALLPGVPLVVAFGLTPWVLVAYEVLDAVVTVFSHANVNLPRPVERALRYALVTPDLHRIHHSSWQPETDSNFGAVFPIWDLVFGTFRGEPRTPHERMELGLEEARGPEAQRLGWLLRSPFIALPPAGGGAKPPAPRPLGTEAASRRAA